VYQIPPGEAETIFNWVGDAAAAGNANKMLENKTPTACLAKRLLLNTVFIILFSNFEYVASKSTCSLQ